MKKILSLFVLMLAMVATSFAAEKTVWEGSEPISWNTEVAPGTQFATPEGTFTGLAKGDIIRAYTTTTYDAPQYVMTYMKGDSWDWTDLETTVSDGVMTYTVADETIATEIATRWIVFRGQAYTLTKITVETPESGGETTGTVIWEGSTTLDWGADPGISVSLEASKFANAKAGDVLKIEGTAQELIQVQVCVNYPWKSSDSYTALPISYTIAEEDLDNIKANGMTIAGQYATITKVTLTTAEEPDPQPAAGETYTAWTGEKVFTSEWSVWEQIPASSFAKAQQDMLLRFRFKDVGAGAQFKVSTAAWADMPDAELVNIDGVYQQYTITAAMLTELQANGCIISGTSFTLISIEVINPADLKPLTLSVPVTGGDWVFENETPTFIIQATNPYEEAVTANAVISIATDKMSPVTTLTKEVEIAAGATENIELSWTEPTPTAGFFKATCTVNDDLARAFFFGVNPTQIVSAPDKQSDFDSFWQTAKDELASIEATDEPVLTKIESKSTDKRTVYLVEFKSVSDGDGTPVTVRGYYAEPNDGKKHPVIMHYQGYDSGYRPGGQDATPWCFDGDGDELSADYAEFILSTRGQSINNRPAADRADGIDKDFENTYGDWFAFNFGYKDKYYYRGAYMDCVRAIDFMATRPTSDMTNLYAEGQSQGGAFTYAAAALSGREFKAIAPGIAFMGDFPDYFEIVNWPAYVARECQQALGMSDEEMYAFLSYFDTKNLATKISDKVAVIATIGVQDNVCPPHTNIAPYNNLAAGTVKEISFNPENAHQVADNWYQVYMNYFASKYVEPQPEPEPATPVFDENGIADLSKMEVQDAEKVTYDAETHTVTTTEGWTGVQLTVADGEEVSGKELRITFDREIAVKCYVKYLDETDADVIMDKAEKILYFTLDETKKLYQVQIQPTEAATFAFQEIKINAESTKPEPEPEPATPVFDEDGKADLSKIEVQDAEKVSYDAETHTVTTTEGWTGVQLTVADGEEVSGKELRVTFDREIAVKCYVKYLDETDADVIMDKAEKILYFALDDTKKLYQVQIQPTEAATFAFQEIKINAESTKPEPEPEPATPVFDEDGVADLSKIEVQDAEKVSYDAETHTVTTTEGWTGVQLTVADGEEVSGKELRITFDREIAVKCYVKYTDETDADVIMDKAEKILYFTLDDTKKLYQVQIQPTEAATFAFQEIKINAESTKPEPEPEPATPVFDEDGVADLSKIEVQDAEKVSYDAETHTVTTTEGWTGVQLTVADGEEVSGKELRVTFDREMAVKCYVKYVDETDADVIMDKAEKILYFTLDETKKLYQVQIQPTEAATFAFQEIKINAESTKPEPEPEPGEKTRTENAQKLFDLLQSLYGNKMISGTTAYVDWNIKQAEQVNEWTGNYPAINTYDFINLHASKDVNPEGWLDYSDISGVKKWASEGGLVSAMWHWQVKNNAGTGYTCTPGTDDAATSFDASKVYVDGTAENTLAKQQLSQICGYLKKMQDAGIPVIWRPLHEAAGNTYEYNGGTAWFWWGAQGADVYKQLWQWMYNYMVNEQGLHNLIWVWTSQTKDGSWYPGNDYVDIIGRDIYGGQAAQQKSDFDALTASYPNMMVALSECGNTNDASQSDISTVWETGAKWSWFSTWYDAAGNQLHNTQSWWTNAFNQDYVVTRAQMKELLDLNIEPDPEPQPEPTTNTFDENGIADLSKVEVQDAGKVTYDAATHTVTTTEGWTGVQLTVADGEQVSGKELRVTFDRAMRVKCYVKYLDETDADVIMDDAAEILYFELDNTKKLYQVQIQPTEAATFAFNEIRVNAESTKPVLKPLEEGEVRTMFEDEEGVVMAWNEICQMDAEWGAILEAGESFLITIKSRTVGSEWPKVILRDANSEGVIEVGLSEVSSYPYIVKMVLTDDIVTKLRNGFRFSGDGITITKIEISKPAPVKEGEVSIEAMNWFRNATYDAATHTGSTSSRWGQLGWAVGDDRYADMTLVIVTIEETSFPVTLKMEYTNTEGKAMATSMGVAAGKTQLNLPLPLDTKVIKKVYLTYAEAADVVLTDASVIAGANARPLTGYEDDGTTAIEEAIVNALSRTRATGIYYDLQGRRVQVPVKGLYIVNGKKVIK